MTTLRERLGDWAGPSAAVAWVAQALGVPPTSAADTAAWLAVLDALVAAGVLEKRGWPTLEFRWSEACMVPRPWTRRLLTVEDRFFIEGRGVLVAPGPLPGEYPAPSQLAVELRLPSGATRRAVARLAFDTEAGSNEHPLLCTLVGLTRDDVPLGTEVWVLGGDAPLGRALPG